MNHPQPPRIFDKILEMYCRKDKLEDLQGDLYEYYSRNLSNKGKVRADLIFLLDVIKFLRPYTLRKLKLFGLMNTIQLFSNYWKTSVRSLSRNKLFTSINIVGLSLSMSVGVLIIVYVLELLSFDNFHTKKERIYRVLSNYKGIESEHISRLASTGPLVYKYLSEDYTGLENVAIMRRGYGADFTYGEKTLALEGLYASDEFFRIFTFPVLHGDQASMLSDPKSVVMTRATATKLFNRLDVVGETVIVNDESYQVTGVVTDPPKNSHIQFEVLVSFQTWQDYVKEANEGSLDGFYGWDNIWMYHVYMLLEEGSTREQIQANLDQISKNENDKVERYSINIELEHLSEVIPGKDLSNRIGPQVETERLYLLALLALITVLSSCFNYTNLSIARSLRRAKEVGIRKVVGATRSQVFSQFIFEAMLLTMIALILSIGLFGIIRNEFIKLTHINDAVVQLQLEWIYIVYFILFGLLIGLISGFLPSFILSKVQSLMAIKDASRLKLMKGVNLRKVLIIFQFTLSIGFIIGATISYRQYVYAVNFDLGYTTDNIINVDLQGNDSQLLKDAFGKVSGVEEVSRSAFVLSSGNYWTEHMKFEDPNDSASIALIYADEQFISVHDFPLLAGSTLPTKPDSLSKAEEGVVTEKLLKRFNIGTPADAIGKKLTTEDRTVTIVGVTRDFHHAKISMPIEPFIFLKQPRNFQHINLKVSTNDYIGLMSRLEEVWDEHDKVHPFKAEFFDEKLADSYNDYMITFKIVGFLSVLAVSIAALGLLGMAVYAAESRLKEISIRKVLGATEGSLVYLLSKGFMYMIGFASLLAVPITYYIFDRKVLGDQANRISIGVVELGLGVLVIFIIGSIMIGWQTLRAARANPASTLRDE